MELWCTAELLLQEGGGRDWLEVTTDTPHGLEAAWLRDAASELVRGARQPRVLTRCRTLGRLDT